MDFFVAILFYWPIKTILWIFPLVIVIYCAYKEGNKKALILLLSMLTSACFSWINQWNFTIFLEQSSIFLIATIIIILDSALKNRQKAKNKGVDIEKHSEDTASF